ncbi:MAG: DMT family transporter [Acidimicrobiales bacterium]
MNDLVAITSALAAAISFAFAALLQQESAQLVDPEKAMSFKLLFDLLRRARWIAGFALMLTGFGLQAFALANGPVALVQPIVTMELALAIPLAIARRRKRAGRREWLGIVTVCVGVSLFLLVSYPAEGTPDPSMTEWLAALIPIGVVAAVVAAFGAASRGPRRAMALGASSGIAFGVLSALTKATTYLATKGVGHVFTSWQPYAAIGVGIASLIISQSAYQAGPLAYSMPFVGVLEPLVAVLIGETILNEQIQLSAPLLAAEVVTAGIAVVGIVLLTTSATVLSVFEQKQTPTHRPSTV